MLCLLSIDRLALYLHRGTFCVMLLTRRLGYLPGTALLVDPSSLILAVQLDQPPNKVNHTVLGRASARLVDASS
jgi:hypothetical protein